MAEDNEEGEPVAVTWSPIYVTLLVSFAQGVIFFLFFLHRRKKDARTNSHQLYETRQFTRAHRSPPPFGAAGAFDGTDKDDAAPPDLRGYGLGPFGWARAAYHLSHSETLRCVGLDSYMYLRLLRLGFRASVVGSLLAVCVLIPLYRTGEARGVETEQFNSITLARVEAGSPRLYGTVLCWYIFVAFLLKEFWTEWQEFATHRYQYLAHGDVDTPKDYRYAILVENVPKSLRSSHGVADYFDHLFPGKVRQATVCFDTTRLDELVAERHKVLLGLEKTEAFKMAKPNKPPLKVRPIGKKCGPKVDATTYFTQRLEELNDEIDEERRSLHAFSDGRSSVHESKTDFIRSMLGMGGRSGDEAAATGAVDDVALAASADATAPTREDEEDAFELNLVDNKGGTSSISVTMPAPPETAAETSGDPRDEEEDDDDDDGDLPLDGSDPRRKMASTAFVTFTSLRAKQSAAQCEISGSYVKMNAFPAPEPSGVLWENVVTPLKKQRRHQVQAAAFLCVGVLFWALPVSFVTAWSNLNSILVAVGAGEVDPNAFWYGLVSGLLPVIALQVLMIVLYIIIVSAASKFIKYKSMTQIDAYALFWHQWYQFANLWLILIGGSAFNQIDSLINDPTSIVSVIATAMPGASVFFINMISVSSFGAFGLQLSMIPSYAIRMIMGLIIPEAGRTQRQLDLEKKPPSLEWGKQLPPLVFIFLVTIMYMPIVPVVELFAMGYFGGSYLVWKHQCLHVYAQEFEGGGTAPWLSLFGFVMGCLYMAQAVFIAYMGIKEGVVQFIMGFVPLVVTIVVHKLLNRNVIEPLRNLSLEVAADVDVDEGELKSSRDDWAKSATAVERQLFGQPCLKSSSDEREPMPYRRGDTATPAEEEDVENAATYIS